MLYIQGMLSVARDIQDVCDEFLTRQGVTEPVSFEVSLTKDVTKGDLYTNLPFASTKILNKNPVAIAIDLQNFLEQKLDKNIFSKIEVAGGYVNFWIHIDAVQGDLEVVEHLTFSGKKIIFDYTDPNPMKEFHIGHLMSNTIGEAFARIIEITGATVKRCSYQGDVGRHIAVTIWGLQFLSEAWPDDDKISLTDKVKHLGSAYVAGNQKLKSIEEKEGIESSAYKNAITEVESINKQVYDRSDAEINMVYDQGREWSLEKFEELYKILGTKFDQYFFESQSGPVGARIVEQNPDVFVEGEGGARIFKGEEYGLHTRVFINKQGLPTYEGKEVGLVKMKWDTWNYDRSYVITANEQDEVFKVTKTAISQIMKDAGERSYHIGHGMMKLVGEKMSSRTGKIVAGDELVEQMTEASLLKMKGRPIEESKKRDIAEAIAVAAIKFTILKQNFRKDIIFDREKALALEGDSGPYIQYAIVRIISLLKKVETEQNKKEEIHPLSSEGFLLKRTLVRFEHVCFSAIDEMAPQHIAQYMIDVASKFNAFYAQTKILNQGSDGVFVVNPNAIELCVLTKKILEKGLYLLGIRVVEEM